MFWIGNVAILEKFLDASHFLFLQYSLSSYKLFYNPNKKTDCWNKLWIKQCIRFISMISYLRVLHVISCTVDKIIKLADCRLFLLEWCAVLVYGEVSVINTAEKRWVKPHTCTWCNIYYKVHWQSNFTT